MHVQNLSPNEQGSWLFAARAKRRNGYDWLIEWYLFHRVRWQFCLQITREDDCCLHIAIPWIISIYLHLPPIGGTDWRLGMAIHSHTLWVYPFSRVNEYRSSDPWWKKGFSWAFPWQWDWFSTQVLEHKAFLPGLQGVVWTEFKWSRRTTDTFVLFRQKDDAAATVSQTYPYLYVRKNGETQVRKATVFVDRMTWRMRWWPLLPFTKTRTCIDVKFDQEVGERTGSWKGGCVGCGYEMRPGETPWDTLKRMESERKFT